MAYNPGVQPIGGQLLGQGILQAAQSISQGIQQRQQRAEQNKVFAAQSKATENLLKSFLPKEQADTILALDPNESPAARHARLVGTIENFVVENKMKEQQNDKQQINELFARFQQTGDLQNALGGYRGSPQALQQVGPILEKFLAISAQQSKPGTVMTMEQIGQLKQQGFDAKAAPIGNGQFMVSEVSPFAPPARTEINMGGDSYEKEVGRLAGEQHMKEYAAATDAPVNLAKLDEVKQILEKGDASTGIGAEIFNNINRLRSQFLADKKAGKSVTDTQVLDALLGSDVFPQIGALGIGARGLDTPTEREFLRQVMTGTINLDKDALLRLTDIRRNVQRRALEKFQKSYEKGTYKKFFEVTGNPVPDFSILEAQETVVAPASGAAPKEKAKARIISVEEIE